MIAFVLTTGTTVVTKNDFDYISTPGLAVEAGRAHSIPSHRSNKPHTIAFNSDGSLKFVELKIMNLRPPSEASFI